MTDKIAEIRERYAGYSLNSGNAGKANEDRGWLLAEVEALTFERDEARAEVERLRADNERLCDEDTKTRHALKGWVFVPPDGGADPTHERVAAVVAEVEKLRAALRDALDGLRYWTPQTSVGAVERCRIMEKAIEALEAKP